MKEKVHLLPSLPQLLVDTRLSRVTAPAIAAFSRIERQRRLRILRVLVRNGQLTVGKHTYGIPKIYVAHPSDRVEIGAFCSVGPDVTLVPGGTHAIHGPSTFPLGRRLVGSDVDYSAPRGPIEIGHDCWLGTGSMILSGVTLGIGTVVAAGAVVTRSTEPHSIVAGVPARVIGRRFDAETSRRVLDSEWWTWPEDQLMDLIPILTAPHPGEFLSFLSQKQ